jgi:16S rRNA processing protein RimM
VSEGLIRIGQITAPHGVRGEVRVQPLTDYPERFATLHRALLGPEGSERPGAAEARPVEVRFKGTARGQILLQIAGITDRNQAEALRWQYLMVPRSEVYPLPEGHYYIFDLIGLAVVDPAGAPLGKLVDVDRNSPAHDLYVVETAPGKRYMVPAVQAYIKEINLEKGYMVVQPVPGLLED